MAFQLSPGVVVTEEDRSTVIPSVATTAGAFAGAFQWGPVEEVTTVDSEISLVNQFGKPNDTTAGYFFTAANFLSYGNNLKLVRVVDKGVAKNAVSYPTGIVSAASVTASNTYAPGTAFVVTFAAPVGEPGDTDTVSAVGNVIQGTTGGIGAITMGLRGLGYSTAPTVTISGSGSGATATAVLGNGELANVTVTTSGNNYSSASNVVIQNQDTTGARANLVIHYKVKDLQISNGGTNYGLANIVVSGGTLVAGGHHANIAPVIVANVITGYTIIDSGNGYTSAPNITVYRLDGNTGTEASITANLGYGYIDRITVDTAGSGFNFAPNVTINKNNALGGTEAAANSRIKALVAEINVTNRGSGYANGAANITITPAAADVPFITGNAAATAVIYYPITGIHISESGRGYLTTPNVTVTVNGTNDGVLTAVATVSANNPLIQGLDDYTTNHYSGGYTYGTFAAKYPGTLGNSLKVSMADGATYSNWQYASQFDNAPDSSAYVSARNGNSDELHIAVIDTTGDWSGTAGTVIEKFSYVSKASDAKNTDGSTNYYKDVIANQSKYIWVIDHPPVGTNWGTTGSSKTFANLTSNVTTTLSGGVSGDSPSIGNVQTGFALFSNDELYDVSLIPMGPTTDAATVNSVIAIAESRRDCMVFASPPYADVVNTTGQADKIVTYRNTLTDTSYAVLDSGWKYQYDRYNDKYRYIPLNGDVAGLAVRTDYIADPWYSPAGYNRGVLKNVVKLAYSPTKADRDTLYRKNINPVVTFPGQGTVLFGDKTLQSKPSAFDRINVRRLFIVLEKAIATASKFQLFEFNDPFTRGQFRNLVEPFLRDVQGRRGITDFRVVCDETNNTTQVIDSNQFVADIYIKPARAINFIQLNFVATRSGVSFEEVGA